MVKAHPYLEKIENYVPGKAKIAGQKKVVKLSSNENALKASPKAIEAYKNHAAEIFRYADGSCELLRQALANNHNIDAEQIVCGAGSDEIIALLTGAYAKEGDEIIYSAHGFLMYPISATRVGARPVSCQEKNLKTDIDAIIKAITKNTKIIFIANPNNPTGSYLNKAQIQKLIDNTPKNILIALDHAYDEFVVKRDDYPDAIALVKKYPNIVMLRTFSKIYGLASLRIGWCYASKEISKILNKMRGPFNVGGPAQVAAIAALNDQDFFEKSQQHNQKWLASFYEKFASFKHIKAYPSIANFILIDFKTINNVKIASEELLQSGYILREMTAYNLPTCLRLTIGTDAENIEMLEILQKIDQKI